MTEPGTRQPSPGNLWFATANAKPRTPALTTNRDADVAIIGGGFTGLTAALHLAKRGRTVVVLEASSIASGASGANAGFVVPNFARADPPTVLSRLGAARGRRLLELVSAGGDRVFQTIRDHAIDCDGQQTGWMHVAHSNASAAMLARRVESWRPFGRPISMLSAAEASALAGVRHCHGALFDASGGTIHPVNYAHGLTTAAMNAGATVYERAPVTGISERRGRWQLRAGGHTVMAGSVLLCTNAVPTGIARRLFRAIVPLPVYQIATKPLPADVVARISPRRNPVADTRSNLFTYRLDRDNRLISGGMAVIPIGAERRMAAMIARRLKHELMLQAEPEIEYAWRGTAAMTTDFMPHIYRFGPRFFGGIGCNGRGIAMTAMLGEVLADAADGRTAEELPVPMAPADRVPMHLLARAAPSFAVAQAKISDWRAGL